MNNTLNGINALSELNDAELDNIAGGANLEDRKETTDSSEIVNNASDMNLSPTRFLQRAISK